MDPISHSRSFFVTALVGLAVSFASAQQPVLKIETRDLSRLLSQSTLQWQVAGRAGDVYVVLGDVATGHPNLLGVDFDLGLTSSLVFVTFGALTAVPQTNTLQLSLAGLPSNVPMHLQFGAWDPVAGFASLRASNLDSFYVHDGNGAVTYDFAFPNHPLFGLTGVFDRTVGNRLQALPPAVRTVHPLPPDAMLFPVASILTPFSGTGARFLHALRASELGSNGVPELLTSVRWRPLFGAVVPQTVPQFELRAALSDVVPDYTIDPFSALPTAPSSGLVSTFAANAIAGTTQTLRTGAYTISPQSLLPSGYVPFPIVQPFVHDGVHTLLLETLCSAGTFATANSPALYLLSQSSAEPFATVAAVGGWSGFPSPLLPASTPSGNGGSYLFDLELEFLRTRSVALSPWLVAFAAAPDWQVPTLAQFTPPGTSIVVEYRGRTAPGAQPTAWSTSPDIADGMVELQFRVTMEANAATGTVPWLDLLSIPYL